MDTMKIRTPFMKGVLGKALSKLIKSKLTYDISISIGDLDVYVLDDRATIHTTATIDIPKDQLEQILKDAGF